MQRILVAGGAGFIGSHLCELLLEKQYEVVCLDNLLTSDEQNIHPFIDNRQFIFVEDDVTQITPDDSRFQNLSYIFHLASPASPNKQSPRSYINYPIETLQANSVGTKNLLDLAKAQKAKFLFTSTSEVYGDPSISPQDESYFGNVNPNGIRSVYDEAKRFGEAITFAYLRKYGVDCRIIRIFNTFGPKMQKDDGRVVSNFINQSLANQPISIYGKGSQTRSFCFVSDMIEGIARAMFTEGTRGEVINLGNPDERTVRELATIIKEMTHSRSEIRYEDLPEDDPKKRCPDITKAKKLLHWEPKVLLEAGLKETIAYFKSI